MKDLIPTFLSANYPHFNETGFYYQLIQNRALIHTGHRHDFFEVFLILEGRAAHVCDGAVSSVAEGGFVFLSPENVHSFEMQAGGVSVLSLSVLPEKFARFLSALEFSPVYGKVYALKNEGLLKEAARLPSVLGRAQVLLLNAILSDLLSEAVKQAPVEHGAVPLSLLHAIEGFRSPENIGGGVERMAELAGVSRMHLGRLTRKHYGKTPVELIRDLRMHLAAEYLERTTFTLDVIAERVGFGSLSRFHATFKRYFRCTPSSYRKRHLVE